VKDNVTGLVWEVKTHDGGLRDQDLDYTNFGANGNSPEVFDNVTDSGSLIAAVNGAKLCGASDWRLPTARELQNIVDYSIGLPGPTIDPGFFPHSRGVAYWTSAVFAKDQNRAAVVYFDDGRVFEETRDTACAVRLVRDSR
jgi:hypothetical protein